MKIKRIEKSWKNNNFVFVIASYEGSSKEYTHKRRLYQNWKKNRHAFVLDNDVYSFVWDELNNNIGKDVRFEKQIRKDSNKKSNSKDEMLVEIETTCEEEKTTETTVVEIPDGPIRHEKYELIKKCLEKGRNIYLAGPAGSGKNFTVEQIAKDLGWSFYYSNSVQQEYKLTGFIDAGGVYHETEFFKACEEGADKHVIFFLDEMDASIPEVLVLLNSAIANGYFEFPIGRYSFDKVHFVAAGNTVGSGADEQYTGRMVLDQATLDRFVIIEFDYSMNVELKLSNGNADLITFIHQLREVAKESGIRATFSYRCITDVTELEDVLDLKEIIKIAVVKGMDKDTINTLRVYGSTKYHLALRELQGVA